MRTLPDALLEAQQRAPLEWPKVRIRIRKLIGGIRRLDFTRIHTGVEPDGPHAVAEPQDASLNRFRIDPADAKLYRQREPDPQHPDTSGTFGKTTIGGLGAWTVPDKKTGSLYSLPVAATIYSISCYMAANIGTCSARTAIYSNNAGAPDALLAVSQEITGIDTTLAWRTFDLITPVELMPGDYWLVIHGGDGNWRWRYSDGNPNQNVSAADIYADGPSDPFGTPTAYSAFALSIYASYISWPPWTDTGKTALAVAAHCPNVQPRFGWTSGTLDTTAVSPDLKAASKYTLAAAKAVTDIVADGNADIGTCKAKAVIYADSGGNPTTLLATSQELTIDPAYPALHTFHFTTPVQLAAGDYWLGLIVGDNSFLIYYSEGTLNQQATISDTYSDGPSDPFGAGHAHHDHALYIYALLKSDILLAYVASTSPYHVWVIQSPDNGETWPAAVDTGAVSDANGKVAVALKTDGTACILYSRANGLYARKRSAGVWGGEVAASYGLTNLSGISMIYEADWNFAITGINATSQDGIWSGIFGDGYSQSPNTFSPLREIIIRGSTEPYIYCAPFITYTDVFRLFFVERYIDPDTQDRVYFTFAPATADWADNLWREPIPWDLETIYGIAIASGYNDVYLSTPYGVWLASLLTEQWDITDKVIQIEETDAPQRYRSKLKVILDNTAAIFNDFDKMGYEIVFSKGWLTTDGPLYSEGATFQVVGWRFVSPPWWPLRLIYPVGVIGTLEINCEGFWDLAKRYKFRRDYAWAAGTKNLFQILSLIISRLGFEFFSAGSSPTLTNFYPELTIKSGTSAYTVLRKLMSWCPDVLFQRANFIYVKELDAADSLDYSYDNFYYVSHVLYRGSYGTAAWDPNRAQVLGDTFQAESQEFPQIEKVYDRLKRITVPEYPTLPRAQERSAAELRKGEVYTGAPGWVQVPTNCGQEPFDVIEITDTTAGVINIRRRVLGIRTLWRSPFTFWQVLELGAV